MDAELKAILNPGKLVKSQSGFLCSSGRCVYSIEKHHYPTGYMWVVFTPERHMLRHWLTIEQARGYIEKFADEESVGLL